MRQKWAACRNLSVIFTYLRQHYCHVNSMTCRRAYPKEERHDWRTFHCVVQHSKRQYWHSRIDGFKEPKDIFNAVKWNQTEDSLSISFLKKGNQMHVSTDDKASYLVCALLQKTSCSENLESDLMFSSNPCLPFSVIFNEEIYNAVVRIKNNTSEKDGMTTLILRKTWLVLDSAITMLYQHCLNQGWHPISFQDVLLVAIPKSEKRDQSSSQAYRLIALLSVLRKGLECLVAC